MPHGYFDSRTLMAIVAMYNFLIAFVLFLLINLLFGWTGMLQNKDLMGYIHIGLFAMEIIAYLVFVIWRVEKR